MIETVSSKAEIDVDFPAVYDRAEVAWGVGQIAAQVAGRIAADTAQAVAEMIVTDKLQQVVPRLTQVIVDAVLERVDADTRAEASRAALDAVAQALPSLVAAVDVREHVVERDDFGRIERVRTRTIGTDDSMIGQAPPRRSSRR